MAHRYDHDIETDGGKRLIRFHYNADMSGDVTVSDIKYVPSERYSGDFEEEVVASIRVPGEALVLFVMERIKDQYIGNIEQMSAEEFAAFILGRQSV